MHISWKYEHLLIDADNITIYCALYNNLQEGWKCCATGINFCVNWSTNSFVSCKTLYKQCTQIQCTPKCLQCAVCNTMALWFATLNKQNHTQCHEHLINEEQIWNLWTKTEVNKRYFSFGWLTFYFFFILSNSKDIYLLTSFL